MASIGVVCGLRTEAACVAGRPGLVVRTTGARPGAARPAATALLAAGCRGLISFGTAGGLAPDLAPGTLLLADAVILADGRRFAVDGAWRQRLAEACGGEGVAGPIAAMTEPLFDAGGKARCHAATGAVAVDMESGDVAEVATAAGVPFLVVRAIADPADRAVPAWVMASLAADGGTRLLPVLAGLARRPADLVPLLRLAGEARAALRRLRRVAPLLPLFDLRR